MDDAGLNKILYIEDEPDIQTVAKLALETVGGFTVEICGSGDMTLERAPDFEPDLILLDVMMPGMDGPETLSALRRIVGLSDAPVIFMTAKVMGSEVERYEKLGAVGVIPKPFDPMTLADRVREIWNARDG